MDAARRLENQIRHRLHYHLKESGFKLKRDGTVSPRDTTKESYRNLHALQRREKLERERTFIEANWPDLQSHFADGSEVEPSAIRPRLEVISAGTWQSNLFRLASLSWSVPVSQGYGRRLRFLVWDDSNRRLMGLMALGDPVFNLRVRDDFVGWSVRYRQSRLVDTLDAYVLGALPPYNALLGGKTIACLVRTKEVRDTFRHRYSNYRGIISGRKKNPALVMVTTTSSLGKSAVYDRLTLAGVPYFRSLGFTRGWGHFHIPDDLFGMIREYLALSGHKYSKGHEFGDGPNWKLRAVRQALVMLGINESVLNHGIGREVFACTLADNALDVLSKRDRREPVYRSLLSVEEVGALARSRWMVPRSLRKPDYRGWTKEGIADLLTVSTIDELRSTSNSCPQEGSANDVGRV
ncbi:MAG: DUF4338 domain-containing protein [Nitrososphaerota archaeon]|nr:DUF4338 domain-containing protein [Nitrososphaerota archaeon]